MGLYEQHEAMSPQFDMFLWAMARDYSEGVNNYGFWTNIASSNYYPSISQESQIWSPIHRLIHRIVTSSINHKKT